MLNKKIFSIILLFTVLGYLAWRITSDWNTISTFKWNFNTTDLILFIVLLPTPFLANVWAWHLVTRSQGIKISFPKNYEIWMISNFVRYLPGGIWQYPSRVLLLSREGISKETSIKCLLLESLFVGFTGLLLVLFVFLDKEKNLSTQDLNLVVLTIFSLIFFFYLIKSQRFSQTISRLFTTISGKEQIIGNVKLPFKWIPTLVFGYFLAFLFPSTILFVLAKGVVSLNLNTLELLLGGYAASWLIGYVAFFAPAGIGVREASLAGFLSLYMPFSVAAIVVIALRIALFISEAVGFGLVIIIKRWQKGNK